MKLVIVRDLAKFSEARRKSPEPTNQDGDEFELVKRWDASIDLKGDVKKYRELKDAEGRVLDYLDVSIKGYLSTFESVTKADRQGDAVEQGAFKDTITDFMKNPVLLVDHINMVEYLAGRFTKVFEDSAGLGIEASVSNSPDMQAVRFKIAEGHLKALSMGGLFYYKEDRRTIFKVKLWEGSLVSIPANQDALFQVRSLNDTEKKFLKSGSQFPDYYAFLRAQQLQNQMGLAA